MLFGLTSAAQASCLHLVSSKSKLVQQTSIVAPVMSGAPLSSSSMSSLSFIQTHCSVICLTVTWHALTRRKATCTGSLRGLPLRSSCSRSKLNNKPSLSRISILKIKPALNFLKCQTAGLVQMNAAATAKQNFHWGRSKLGSEWVVKLTIMHWKYSFKF